MSLRFIIRVVGKLLALLAGAMCVPAAIALFEVFPIDWSELLSQADLLGFLVAIISSYVVGTIFVAVGRKAEGENSAREGFAVVTFGWIIVAFFGSVPFFVYLVSRLDAPDSLSVFACFTNACFESMSGFTGTGSTIFGDIEALPTALIFWRSLMQWLGGMGVATLALAIFPAFGVSAYQIFRGESSGPKKERLTPRLAQTGKVLWGVYILLTVVQTVLLLLGGMSLFDAVCHSFSTVATGGFSTRNQSVGAFGSAYIEWVVICFTFLGGMNFMIHYRVLFGRTLRPLVQNKEFHFYAGIILAAVVVVFFLLRGTGVSPASEVQMSYRSTPLTQSRLSEKCAEEQAKLGSVHDTIRHASFQVVSMTACCGFCTADFDVWPNLARFMLVLLMFFGGCAGSTSGGIKMIRILVLLKASWREIKTMIQPRLISPVKIAGAPIEEKLVTNILSFIALYVMLFVAASALMCMIVPDIVTAMTAVATCMSNTGPGLAGVGATETFAWIPLQGKWVLFLCMLLGRLEIYTVLIALAPRSYRR